MSKKILIGGVILGVALIVLNGVLEAQPALGMASSSFFKYTGDVIGSKTGTSTVYVEFGTNSTGGRSATSSYVTKIDNRSTVAYFFQVGAASSSADVLFSILASNDDYCDTATSSADYGDPVIKSNINWFDAAPFLDGHAAQSLTNGSSTPGVWNTSNGAGTGRTVLLTNVVAQCLKLDINASSTKLRAEIRTK